MNIIKFKPQLILSAILCMGMAAMFTSCSKNDDSNNDQQVTHIRAVNAVEGSASQDLYIDNTKVTASAVAYGEYSDYISQLGGSHNAKFSNSGSVTANASFTLSILPANYYTIYYTTSDTTKGIFVTHDDPSVIATKAKVRFVQLSSAAAATVDFGISGAAKLVTNLGYQVVSDYYVVDANTTFAIYAAGSSTVLLNIPTTVQAGSNYTIYISGSTALTVGAHVITER